MSPPVDNPFRASRIRPGIRQFIFGQESLGTVIRRFRAEKDRGQIVGPHGTGKSTLLYSIVDQLEAAAVTVRLIRLPAGIRPSALLSICRAVANMSAGQVLALDGYEQLPWTFRGLLGLVMRCKRLGILVTTHHAARLPVLLHTRTSSGRARQVIESVLEQSQISRDDKLRISAVIDQQLPDLLQRHNGNMREVMFDLYDQYQDISDE